MRLSLIIIILLLAGYAQAATLTVCPSGCEYSSIRAAVDVANSGDTIEIHSGEYYGEGNIYTDKNLNFIGVDTGGGKPILHGNIAMIGSVVSGTISNIAFIIDQYPSLTSSTAADRLPYSEDFSSAYNWAGQNFTVAYRNGRAHLTVLPKNFFSYHIPATNTYRDFILEVEAAQEGGPDDNGYGVVFRLQDNNNFYRFAVSGDGYYKFDKWVAGEQTEIVKWTTSSAINRGRASNLLKVEAQGSKLTFYVNGVRLGQYTDSSFASGKIGIGAVARTIEGVHISFDNLKVWAVDKGTSTPSNQMGGLLYSYDFSGSFLGNYCVERDGRMHITVPKSYTYGSWGLTEQVKNFVSEVDATQEGGPDDNDYGLILRYVDNDNFYSFSISGDGYYCFYKKLNGQWRVIVPWAPSDSINKGKATNHIKVRCEGSKFTFYVNGVMLRDCTDSSFSSGSVYVAAATRSQGGVHISFDNLKVWAI